MRLASLHLAHWFSTGVSIVTPSAVTANVAAKQLAEDRLQSGQGSWERPPIQSMDAWLVSCWQEARYSDLSVPALLSPSQELLLWQQIVESHHSDIFDSAATARLARRSAQLLAQWHIPLEGEAWNDHQDAEHFQQWLREFRRACQTNGWIVRSDLPPLLPAWLQRKWLDAGQVVFAGFEEWSPSSRQLAAAVPQSKILEAIAPKPRRKAVPVKQFEDIPAELEGAARWARALFEQDPKPSIALVIPNLAAHRDLAERTLHSVFFPSTGHIPESSLFHFSEPSDLLNQPPVASALLLLELAQPRINHADACAILRSPYTQGAIEERSARAQADLRLRKTRELDVSLREIEWASRECPLLQRLWRAAHQILSRQAKVQELPAWSEFMGDLLEAMGWPGDSDLNPREQTMLESWKNALSNLASLGLVAAPVSYSTALKLLRRLLASEGAESGDWYSPIQLLSPKDAAGLTFDRLFITGLSDETWRPRVTSSPLIPLRLQRQYQVPGSSVENEWERWSRVTKSLFSAAPVIAGSYSQTLAPVARPFVSTVKNQEQWAGILPQQAFSQEELEVIGDARAPALSAQPSRGGTYILKAQSACPFKAFAEIRLNAESPDEASFGFDARDRGGFMHKGLELIWKQLESQDRLRATPAPELRSLIHTCLREAVHCDERDSQFHIEATAAERERLGSLIEKWLEVESHRIEPFSVETLEQQRTVNIGGLQLTLRTDRIDRLPNGKLVLIDYKSGEQTLKKLQPPRPEEPQLLVYAAALGAEVEGIFFAQVKCGKLQAVGYSRAPQFDGKAVEVLGSGWSSAIKDWSAEVESLARGFMSGHAAVDPKTSDTCTYCQVKPFCRIGEREENTQEWS